MRKCEKILLVAAAATLIIGILLGVCIGLVLPKSWTKDNYTCESTSDKNKVLIKCSCEKRDRHLLNRCTILNEQRSLKHLEEEPNQDNIKTYPYLVSLSMPAYVDDDARVFSCNGIILSKIWVLTGDACVNKTDIWEPVRITAGSDYWHTGGTIFRIETKYIGPNDLSGLRVNPDIIFNAFMKPVVLPTQTISKSSTFTTSGWEMDYLKSLKDRKLESFDVKTLSNTPCSEYACQKSLIRTDSKCNFSLTGKALILGCNTLVAFQCKTQSGKEEESTEFISLVHFHGWIKTLLSKTKTDPYISRHSAVYLPEELQSKDALHFSALYSELNNLTLYQQRCCKELNAAMCNFQKQSEPSLTKNASKQMANTNSINYLTKTSDAVITPTPTPNNYT